MAKILVIDDDTSMRRTVSRILTSAGHEVIEAPDGQEGMNLFRTHRPACPPRGVTCETQLIFAFIAFGQVAHVCDVELPGWQRFGPKDKLHRECAAVTASADAGMVLLACRQIALHVGVALIAAGGAL